MKQIVINWLVIFIMPFLFGAVIRILCRRYSKAWLITAIGATVSVVCFVIAQNPPVSGSELYGLRMVMAFLFTTGSFITGAILRIIKRRK